MIDYTELFSLGSKFNILDSKSFFNVESASLFEALPNGLGYLQILYLNSLSEKEKDDFFAANIQVRCFVGNDGFLITLLHLEETNLFIEMEFDPTLYVDDRALQMGKTNDDLHFLIVESSTLCIEVLKKWNIPLKLLNFWLTHWTKAMEINDFSSKYGNWVRKLRRQYDTDTLWSMAKPICVLKNDETNT